MTPMNLDFYSSTDKPESRSAMITIPLDLPDVRVLATHINDQSEIIITVESTLERCRCKHCQRKIKAFHQHDEWITIRHLSVLGRPTYIRMQPKRYNCARCARQKGKKKVTSTQQLPWHQAKSPYSRAYEQHVLLQLVNSTIADVSVKDDLGYDAVEGIVERNVRAKVDWEQFGKLAVLGLDEIALKKGHRDYVVLITARLADGRLKILTVLPDRKKKTVTERRQYLAKQHKYTNCFDAYAVR